MINWIKNLFKKKNNKTESDNKTEKNNFISQEVKNINMIKTIKLLKRNKVIDIGTADKCYEYYLDEIDMGAIQYRVVEDKIWNEINDMDDMEDHYCMLKIQIKYTDGKTYDRYRLFGEVSRTHSYMNNLEKNYTKEDIERYINYLKSPNF